MEPIKPPENTPPPAPSNPGEPASVVIPPFGSPGRNEATPVPSASQQINTIAQAAVGIIGMDLHEETPPPPQGSRLGNAMAGMVGTLRQGSEPPPSSQANIDAGRVNETTPHLVVPMPAHMAPEPTPRAEPTFSDSPFGTPSPTPSPEPTPTLSDFDMASVLDNNRDFKGTEIGGAPTPEPTPAPAETPMPFSDSNTISPTMGTASDETFIPDFTPEPIPASTPPMTTVEQPTPAPNPAAMLYAMGHPNFVPPASMEELSGGPNFFDRIKAQNTNLQTEQPQTETPAPTSAPNRTWWQKLTGQK